MKHAKGLLLLSSATALALPTTTYAAPERATEFSYIGSISNTRHNLTQRGGTEPSKTINTAMMDPYRNDYGEVCVYCHTPHGANSQANAPLWNRTINNQNNYTTYDTLGTSTLTSSVAQPGINSLTCLSCHDGTIAMDSVINMPGSGLYDAAQEILSTATDSFLDKWSTEGPGNRSGSNAESHWGFGDGTECMSCHSNPGFPGAPDFSIAYIGTDLTNDHPIGIDIPTGRFGSDFFEPTDIAAGIQFYETDGNDRADKDEIRFYDTGAGARVECASCHDPHGVTPRGSDPTTTKFNPTFLRISNDGSAVCLTCHDK